MKLLNYIAPILLIIATATFVEATTTTELRAKIAAWENVSKQKDGLILSIQDDLKTSQATVTRMEGESATLQTGLNNWKSWGEEESSQKTYYYNASVDLQKKLDKADKERVQAIERYHRVKLFFSLIAGTFSMILYLKFNTSNSLTSALSGLVSSFAPAGIIIQILGPILAFAAGFAIVFLPF